MTYSEKLKDPRWQRKRLEVMERDNFTCLGCGDTKTTLNVHHLRYSGMPWESPDEDLETLCEPCHQLREFGNCLAEQFKALPACDVIELFRALNDFANVRHDGRIGKSLTALIRGHLAALQP